MRAKLSKEERLAMVRAGREDRESYKSKIAVKQKKVFFIFHKPAFWGPSHLILSNS